MTDEEVVKVSMTLFLFFATIGLYAICTVACNMIMEARGRSKLIGTILGLIGGPIGVVVCFCLPANEEKIAAKLIASGKKKKCSECGSLISVDAKRCPFCCYAKEFINQLEQIEKNKRV